MILIIYREYNYKTTCINPHQFLYSICGKYCTDFKPLFLAKSAYFHPAFPYIYLKSAALFTLYTTVAASKLVTDFCLLISHPPLRWTLKNPHMCIPHSLWKFTPKLLKALHTFNAVSLCHPVESVQRLRQVLVSKFLRRTINKKFTS